MPDLDNAALSEVERRAKLVELACHYSDAYARHEQELSLESENALAYARWEFHEALDDGDGHKVELARWIVAATDARAELARVQVEREGLRAAAVRATACLHGSAEHQRHNRGGLVMCGGELVNAYDALDAALRCLTTHATDRTA